MKRFFLRARLCVVLSIFLISGFLNSCATPPKVTTFWRSPESRILYSGTVSESKGAVAMLSSDIAFYAGASTLNDASVFNYTLAIPNLSAQEITETRLSLKSGGNVIPVEADSVLYKDIFRNRRDCIAVRMSAKISIEDSEFLLKSEGPLEVLVVNEAKNINETILAAELQERIHDIARIL